MHVIIRYGMTLSDVATQAGEFLDMNGWAQGYLCVTNGHDSGRFDLAGALMLAATGSYVWDSQDQEQVQVLRAVAGRLVRKQPSLAKIRSTDRARDLRVISAWNDKPGRTKKQVQEFLHELAKEA